MNKHKPWIETTYHGIVTENDDKVLLDPPLIALDKDAPLRYAGEGGGGGGETDVTSSGLQSVGALRQPRSLRQSGNIEVLTHMDGPGPLAGNTLFIVITNRPLENKFHLRGSGSGLCETTWGL